MRKLIRIVPIARTENFNYEMQDGEKKFFTNTVTNEELMAYSHVAVDPIQKTYVEEALEQLNKTAYFE